MSPPAATLAAPVALRADGPVLTVTITRPETRNAIDQEVAVALHAAWDRLETDPALRAAVLTGAGGCFSSGMDLHEFARTGRPPATGRGFAGTTDRPPAKPVVVAVEGIALGGGLELVLACDLIVAARSAEFRLPETTLGFAALGGGLARLPSRLPYHRAVEFALLGERLDAAEAHALGLVNQLVADGEALGRAQELAARLAALPPAGVRATKQVLAASSLTTAARHAERVAIRTLTAETPNRSTDGHDHYGGTP